VSATGYLFSGCLQAWEKPLQF